MSGPDPYAECTCGHYYDDHVGTACMFYGCGCGALAAQVAPSRVPSEES